MSRRRNWCFTSFGIEISLDNVGEGKPVRYVMWGDEVCPDTGRKHFQGYAEFYEGVTLHRAQTLLGLRGVHFEARKGSQKQAVEYCKKKGVVTEHGDAAKQGKRKDLDSVRDILADGGGVRDVLLDHCNYQGVRFAEQWLTYLEEPNPDDCRPTVIWYWGATGTGKSRAARAEAAARPGGKSDVYCHDGSEWWNGYDRHKVVIMDDFRPEDMKFQKLLKLLDYGELRVPFKGGYRQFVAEVVYITIPQHPDACYGSAGEDVAQLIRRIDIIKEFKD